MEKQLKEIEIPFGAKDSELCGWEYTIPEGMEATIVDNKIVVKKKESGDEKIKKEQSIEEKARRYDKALERVNKLKETCDSNAVVGWMEYIFPELKESGDIRKRIIDALHGDVLEMSEIKDATTWLEKQGNLMKALQISNAKIGELIEKNYYLKEQLEKQGEQKSIDEIAKEVSKDKTSAVAFLKGAGIMNENGELAEQYRQDKQNPNDNVEPKFKVGDWIVYNRNDSSREILYVYDIRDDRYYFNDNIHFSWSVKECDEKCHLWTIDDVKDGDVVAQEPFGTYEKPFVAIYKGRGLDHFVSYCFTSFDGKFNEGTGGHCLNVHPATKEQCEQLEKAMTEAGYTFDFDKKELKEIEQSPVWSEEDVNMFGGI